jgi:hypothetical protein
MSMTNALGNAGMDGALAFGQASSVSHAFKMVNQNNQKFEENLKLDKYKHNEKVASDGMGAIQ